MYKLPIALSLRLRNLGISEEEEKDLILKYNEEALEYIALMLPNFKLTEKQESILTEAYIQYQLFAYVEIESLVRDKKIFLEEMIEKIKENNNQEKQEVERKLRIRVF